MLTCTGVSFAHGSNDGQKGMGLIMLILVGTVPTAYALNRAVSPSDVQDFIAVSAQAAESLDHYAPADAAPVTDARADVTEFVRSRTVVPATIPGMSRMIRDIATDLGRYKELRNVPADQTRNFRNDLYLVGEGLRLIQKKGVPVVSASDADVLKNYKKHVDTATKFIPLWVKISVAIALGLGTMVGWKRIVVTVGEKIGKDHLTYAQGAAAELTAMATIGAADMFGLPVSTTHVLSSGVAGTMAANRSGLQMSTVRNLLLAWVLTLPVSILLSGGLFFVFSHLF
jgi:PiT family inorganic phosphate transporter